ncbi:DUF3717 domain-containing protein [Paraburkholderia sp. UYCP14C]|jgi:hypothetical protein|uniref:DUF3717 domain-containing protein n=1 Tax=Paraburkholderia sp. UYCP14C TaxID=2511130 RepID=UPI00102099CB|nr:DUF3717 domain-containing protein [Paraburkholderia sp. UYCP14C]RZF26098.1 DUF3717 domain-containing protein [Paraburkholderia sp. UYCP14C]
MNKPAFTISEIEQAINYWCARQVPGEDGALCAKARPLADLYGLMIFEHSDTVEAAKLNDDQLDALRVALYQQDLPL